MSVEIIEQQRKFWPDSVARWVAVALAIFQIYTSLFGSLDAYMQRVVHLLLGLLLTFLVYYVKGGRYARFINIIITLIGTLLSLGYILVNYNYINLGRFSLITPLTVTQTLLGIVLIALVLEGTRRVAGSSLFWVVIGFIVYVFLAQYLPGILHSTPYKWTQVVDYMYLGTGGIFGIPLGVSATDIAVFIIFGAFMVKAGVGNLLFDIGAAMAGKSSGGIGKVAVLSSALMGMITGSGTANVATVGILTIPAMKKAGYKPFFAGAVEAAASTGGQIMPPVMGATAFVISAFTGIPYITITIYAIIPAILYFAGIYFSLDLEARRLNLKGFEPERGALESLKLYGHTIFSVAALIILLMKGFSPGFSAAASTLILIAISWLRPQVRLGIKEILLALESGAKGTLVVIVATAAAGIIVGSLDLTSLGNRFSGSVMDLTGGSLLIGLVLTMLISILLGMGMPTTPAYVLQVALVIPALITMGLPLYIAHFYAFYFSCLSLITPPVAITAYAAAGIAGSGIWETGWAAFRIALPSYIVPFAFAYSPALLLQGNAGEIVFDFITAMAGVYAMSIATRGFWRRGMSIPWRIVCAGASILLILPFWQISLAGVMVLLLAIWFNSKASGVTKLSSEKSGEINEG